MHVCFRLLPRLFWRNISPSRPKLLDLTRNTFLASDRTYGARCVSRDLLAGEWEIGQGTVINCWADPGADWTTVDSEHFRLRQRATGASCAHFGEPRTRTVIAAVGKELDQEYENAIWLKTKPSNRRDSLRFATHPDDGEILRAC
jgi:hypothetical protein